MLLREIGGLMLLFECLACQGSRHRKEPIIVQHYEIRLQPKEFCHYRLV